MDLINIAGWIAALIIGITLGLIGGGGSILTVPVLVYFLDVDPVLATAYSLFIVGITALSGSFSYFKQKNVDLKAATVFAIPSFIAVFLTRYLLVPAIPDPVFLIGQYVVSKGLFIMVFFAVIMFASALSMITSRKRDDIISSSEPHSFNYPLILFEGTVVGILTGLVGAGGGFLIIPALVLFAKIPMRLAVGTSLVIIAAKSLIGFLGDIGQQPIDWPFLLLFSLLSIIGILFGSVLSQKIQSTTLKKGFGWFVLIMSMVILMKELL